VRKRTTAHREAFDLALRQIKRGSARYERTRNRRVRRGGRKLAAA
jgi:hypothetical protein